MKTSLFIVCCALICTGCEGVIGVEVCPSLMQPIHDTDIKLDHTTQVDPGTICQCTALTERTKCMVVKPSPPDDKFQPVPSFLGGMDRERWVQVAVDNDRCISRANLRFRADSVNGQSINITGPPEQVALQCKRLHNSAKEWGSLCNVTGPSDRRDVSIICNRGPSRHGYISCSENSVIQVKNVLFGVNLKDPNKCTRDHGDHFFNVHCLREVDSHIPNTILSKWNNKGNAYNIFVYQIETCNNKTHCAVNSMKNEARVSYVVVEYTCSLGHETHLVASIWPWIVGSVVFLVLTCILVVYCLRRRRCYTRRNESTPDN